MKTTNIPERKADYYDILYGKSTEYKKAWQESRYLKLWKQVLDYLPLDKDIKIFDAGCGAGQMLAMFWDLGYKNLKGMDFSQKSILMANIQRPDVAEHEIYTLGEIFTHDVSGYDVITCTEVLEHVENDLGLISYWAAKKKTVILSVPSFGDPGHVRYFESCQDVINRYGKYFKNSECVEIISDKKWYVFKGE